MVVPICIDGYNSRIRGRTRIYIDHDVGCDIGLLRYDLERLRLPRRDGLHCGFDVSVARDKLRWIRYADRRLGIADDLRIANCLIVDTHFVDIALEIIAPD